MNIYFCREKDEYAGLFVIAPTRGKAKELFAYEVDCSFVAVRTEIRRKDVDEDKQRCLFDIDEDLPILTKHGLFYEDAELFDYI